MSLYERANFAALVAEQAQRKVLPYNSYFPDTGKLRRELYPRSQLFWAAGLLHRERIFLAANRVGKAQPLSEPVLTPTGFVPMGTLKVGDRVIGSDGTATRVVTVYPQGVRNVVRVRCSDGSSTRCDRDHLWSVRPVRKGRLAPFQVMSTSEIAREMATGRRFALPPRAEVCFTPAHELPVDAYLLGLLLGDGGLSQQSVHLTTIDPEIVTYCEQIAADYGCVFERCGTSITYAFLTTLRSSTGGWFNRLRDLLKGLDVAGHTAHTKRIPPSYLVADRDTRLSVLQGLMDTDGYCCVENSTRAFNSVSQGLCEDVAFLARSLGIIASVAPKQGSYKGAPHYSWQTSLRLSDQSVFRLPRKKTRERQPHISQRAVVLETIEDDGAEECQCIRVAAADHLYVTNDFLVTHNTVTAAFEVTAHLTGRYPTWWPGRQFEHPTEWWVAGDTLETTRNVIQFELCGPRDAVRHKRYAGMLPPHLIADRTLKSGGVPDVLDTLWIQHVERHHGAPLYSTVEFKAYNQGRLSFQGTSKHGIWLDEEPPDISESGKSSDGGTPVGDSDIYTECLLRTATTEGLIMATFTPLRGLTPFLEQYLEQAEMVNEQDQIVNAKAHIFGRAA